MPAIPSRLFPNGTAAAPSIAFLARPGDGFCSAGAGLMVICLGGVGVANFQTGSGVIFQGGGVGAFLHLNNSGAISLTGAGTNANVTAVPTGTGGFVIGATSGIRGVRTAVATLDFPSILANVGTQDLTVTVTGATVGDVVQLGLPAAPDAGVLWRAWVSAANTVTIRATNISAGAIDPASASYRVTVMSH